jgi:hypothetical protein
MLHTILDTIETFEELLETQMIFSDQVSFLMLFFVI